MRGFSGGFLSAFSNADWQRQLSGWSGSKPENLSLKDDYFLLKEGSFQQQATDERYSISFYGSFGNAALLRQELHLPQTTDDAHTLLSAWKAWGAGCFAKLSGSFAVAIYDSVSETLYLARDPLGVKPLYIYQNKGGFLFATNIKQLLQLPGLNRETDASLLYYYLIFLYLPGEQTLFKNIRKLPPGHFGVYKKTNGSFEVQRYYSLPFGKSYSKDVTEKEWTDHLEQQLLGSLERLLKPADAVCLSLSGGLDSSLLAAMSVKILGAGKLPCFTVGGTEGMRQEGFGSDLAYAQKVAKQFGLKLQPVPGDLQLKKELDRMVWQLEAPHGDPAAIHHLHLSEAAAAEGYSVMLGGAAADDVFAGYRRHQAMKWLFLRSTPAFLKPALQALAGMKGEAWRRRAERLLNNAGGNREEQLFANFFWLTPQAAEKLFSAQTQPMLRHMDPFQFMRRILAEIPNEKHPLHQMLALELRIFLGDHNLPYLEKLSAPAGIEVRSPYLNTELIACSAGMPPGLKLKGNTTKYILKKVAERYLPKEIIYRKKTGFAAPIRGLLRGSLAGFVRERLLEGSLRQKGVFNEKEIENLLSANASGRTDAAYPIFTLLAIESWLRQFDNA